VVSGSALVTHTHLAVCLSINSLLGWLGLQIQTQGGLGTSPLPHCHSGPSCPTLLPSPTPSPVFLSSLDTILLCQ
jgi:hypothetical protein